MQETTTSRAFSSEHPTEPSAPEAVTDPVCGMSVTLGNSKLTFEYQGTVYHFDNSACRDKFKVDPFFYVSGNSERKKAQEAESAPAGVLYTCPMHPEIVQEGPGTCPLCGMALEPMSGVSDEPNDELIDFSRRLWISVLAAIPLLFITMGPMLGIPIQGMDR